MGLRGKPGPEYLESRGSSQVGVGVTWLMKEMIADTKGSTASTTNEMGLKGVGDNMI